MQTHGTTRIDTDFLMPHFKANKTILFVLHLMFNITGTNIRDSLNRGYHNLSYYNKKQISLSNKGMVSRLMPLPVSHALLSIQLTSTRASLTPHSQINQWFGNFSGWQKFQDIGQALTFVLFVAGFSWALLTFYGTRIRRTSSGYRPMTERASPGIRLMAGWFLPIAHQSADGTRPSIYRISANIWRVLASTRLVKDRMAISPQCLRLFQLWPNLAQFESKKTGISRSSVEQSNCCIHI